MHKAFSVHMLNQLGKSKAGEIAVAFHELLEHLESICPSGRELAIVVTKLEEACFFAKKAMASEAINGIEADATRPPDYPTTPELTADGAHELVAPPAEDGSNPPHDPAVAGLKPTT